MTEITTPHGASPLLVGRTYEAIVARADAGELAARAAAMRAEFQRRTGAYGPEDAWFENRSRAFWDDALAKQGFAVLAAAELEAEEQAVAHRFAVAQRGFFLVEEADDRGALLVDAWSGAELLVRHLDETQAMTLEHAEGAMDARVIRGDGTDLFVLPGAFHHPADAVEPALDVLIAARKQGLSTDDALDALLRMELVFRSSSRVKAAFAYRIDALGPRLRGESHGRIPARPPVV